VQPRVAILAANPPDGGSLTRLTALSIPLGSLNAISAFVYEKFRAVGR
jgi:hypothetical protein